MLSVSPVDKVSFSVVNSAGVRLPRSVDKCCRW